MLSHWRFQQRLVRSPKLLNFSILISINSTDNKLYTVSGTLMTSRSLQIAELYILTSTGDTK